MARVTFHVTTPVAISVTVNGRAPTWGNVPPLEIKLALLDAIDKMDTNDLKQLRFESTVHGKSAESASTDERIEVRTAGDSDELVRGGDRFGKGPAVNGRATGEAASKSERSDLAAGPASSHEDVTLMRSFASADKPEAA